MRFQELRIVRQGGVFAQLLGDFRMGLQESIEFHHLRPISIAAESVLLPHESIGIVRELLPNFRAILQKHLEFRMAVQKLGIVSQRRIAAKLLGDFLMAIQELIELC